MIDIKNIKEELTQKKVTFLSCKLCGQLVGFDLYNSVCYYNKYRTNI